MRAKWVCTPLAVLFLATPADAEDCKKPLTMIASLPMTDLGTNGVTIPVSLNGVEKQFLLDTGGFFTQISSATANELKLGIKQSDLELVSEDGSMVAGEVFVPDFALGPLHAERYKIPVSPHIEFDGIFSPVAFETVDFEIDFSAHKLNMFSNDHCDGKVIYWPSKAFGVVPFTVDEHNHIVVPVSIDGHDLEAMIDTGQTYTTVFLNSRTERVLGLQPGAPDMTVVGHIGNNQSALIYSHTFKTLTFGDIVVSNPNIPVFTDVQSERTIGRGGTASSPVIIGMDVLRKLHLFLALKERKLYLTEAAAASSATPTSAPK